MTKPVALSLFLALLAWGESSALAWGGFDAATTKLVEIPLERVPFRGETVDVHTYDGDKTEPCLVESITRNKRTVEITVRTAQDNRRRTLIMEGK